MRTSRITPAAILAAFLLPAAANAQPTFTPFGDLFGGSYGSAANGVSADGTVAVGYASGPSGAAPFQWSGGIMTVVPGLPGAYEGEATAASADGSVIVGFNTFAMSPTAGFRWTASGGTEALTGFPEDAIGHIARGVSGDGSVVTGLYSTDLGWHAYRWTSAGVETIGDLSEGIYYPNAWGNGVSNDGSTIVGGSVNEVGLIEAFRQKGAALTGLGDLSGGDFWSQGRATSADGSVVVGRGTSASGMEAFRWEDDVLIGLGDLPGGTYQSEAFATSADGSIVVGYGATDTGTHAMIWTAADGMLDLKDYLLSLGAEGLDGWTLSIATGISADGSTIVGTAVNPDGFSEGFMVTIPAPGAALAFALAAAFRRSRA